MVQPIVGKLIDNMTYKVLLFQFSSGEYSLYECMADDKIELMQSTGLRDKNGKEIFESDIFEYTLGSIDGTGTVYREVVEWGEHDDVEGHKHLGFNVNSDLEPTVIGNIHENPDLIPQDV